LRTPQGVTVRVIAGESHGVAGAVRRDITQPLYLDLHFEAGAHFAQPLPAAHNAFVYVYRGELRVGDTPVPAQRMAILANGGDGAVLHADAPARALLIAGRPLNEPIVQHGPFVMNTKEQIIEAVQDFQAGRFAQA
jgi:redox-sensitive bicupin YhaK (pirin superfamily)